MTTRIITIVLGTLLTTSFNAFQGATMDQNNTPIIGQNSPQKIQYLGDTDITEMCVDLMQKLPKKEWTGILAVCRGGLSVVGTLSQHMNIKCIETICLKSYNDDRSQGKIELIKSPGEIFGNGENWLVIDDLSDTGNTIRYMRNLYQNATYATLIVKPKGKDVVDYFSKEYPQDTWLHFHWEPKGK